jgi:hypothetical protein
VNAKLQARQRRNSLARWREAGDPDLVAAIKDHEAAELAEHAQKIIDKWPTLTDEQKSRIAALLRAPGQDAAA